MNYGYVARVGDCLNCGKEAGALYSHSQWGHSHRCCSDTCGQALGKKLDDFYQSKEYKKLQKAVGEANINLAKACYKATGI